MNLHVILGPMKSGKSHELISHFAPLGFTDISHGLFQSVRNVRDQSVWSRNGTELAAQKVQTLEPVYNQHLNVVGIDEFHMFAPEDAHWIEMMLREGTKVVVSSLDTDYQGKLFETVSNLLQLGPAEVKFKRSVCENCKAPHAIYSQIFKEGEPLLDGMPPVIPDDGTFTYKPVCRKCFIKIW